MREDRTAVFERVLKRLREKVRRREYVMSIHAEEEMDDDGLTIIDIESSVLTGRVVGVKAAICDGDADRAHLDRESAD